jgi:maltooligosyltrehalose synthase
LNSKEFKNFEGLSLCNPYQGSELWDLNLVDPDNRRPVDYPLREKALTEVALS